MVALASLVPSTLIAFVDVIPSLFAVPRSGVIPVITGAFGAVLSMVKFALLAAAVLFPAKSIPDPAGSEKPKLPSPTRFVTMMVTLVALLVTNKKAPLA